MSQSHKHQLKGSTPYDQPHRMCPTNQIVLPMRHNNCEKRVHFVSQLIDSRLDETHFLQKKTGRYVSQSIKQIPFGTPISTNYAKRRTQRRVGAEGRILASQVCRPAPAPACSDRNSPPDCYALSGPSPSHGTYVTQKHRRMAVLLCGGL